MISFLGVAGILNCLKTWPPPTPKWKINGTYYIQPYSWSLEEGGILAGQLQPVSVDREGIRESLMAAVDLEPAERIRANQREEVLTFHASQPSLFYDKREKIFSSIYKFARTLDVRLPWDCFRQQIQNTKYYITGKWYQVHFLTWWIISLHISLKVVKYLLMLHTTSLFLLH